MTPTSTTTTTTTTTATTTTTTTTPFESAFCFYYKLITPCPILPPKHVLITQALIFHG